VILVDTSVWIEHLRGTQSRAAVEFAALIRRDPGTIATCDPIAMELLSGPTDPFTVHRIENQLGSLINLDLETFTDFRQAAVLARAVRVSGHTVRSLVDCLIAVVAIRTDAELWHRDEDFARIAAVSRLHQRDLR